MADPVVHITNGVPDSGTGNITTLGQTLLDGANITHGAIADAAVTAGATGSFSAKLRSISRDIGSLVTAIGSTAWDLGSGTGGTRTQRMIIDSSQLGSLGQATMANSAPVVLPSNWMPTGSAVPASAPYQGAQAITALPAAATSGNLVGVSADKYGRPIVIPITIRDLTGTQTTTISASTAETTIITAGGAGVFNDIVMLVVSNTSASTTTRIDFRDATAGSVLFSLTSIGGQPPVGFCPSLAIPQTTAANNWTAQCSVSTSDIRIYAVYAKNK